MPNKYVDRGIMKWNPFDALEDSDESLVNLVALVNKLGKPILDEETATKINENLIYSMKNNIEVIFKIYFDGSIQEIKGVVKKIEEANLLIKLTNKDTISFDTVVDVISEKDNIDYIC